MPGEVSEELMQYMIQSGYIVIAKGQEDYPINQQEEVLYEFGEVPPESDWDARELFFKLYREALRYQLGSDGTVYRKTTDTRRHRRRRR